MKISIRRISSILFILSCILGMTVEIKYIDTITIPYWFTYLAIVFSCLLGIAIESKGIVTRTSIIGMGLITAYLLLYILISRYNTERYITAFVFFIILFYLYSYLMQRNGHFGDFIYTFADVVMIIGVISLFFWLFGSVLRVLPGRVETTYSFAKWQHLKTYTYYYLYFENPIQNQKLLGIDIPRNCGIFTEAPAFSGLLLYAYGIHVFGPKEMDKKKVLLLLITILSTQSTKALIILIMVFGIRFMFEGNENHSKVYVFIKTLVSILMIVVSIAVIESIMSDKMIANDSFIARVNHLNGGLKTWLQNPFFGAGFENDNAFFSNLNSGAGENGMSMGLTVLLAYGGIYLTLFYIFAIFVATKNRSVKGNLKNYCFFVLMLLVNLFISNSAFGYPYLFFVASGYAAGTHNGLNNREVRNNLRIMHRRFAK